MKPDPEEAKERWGGLLATEMERTAAAEEFEGAGVVVAVVEVEGDGCDGRQSGEEVEELARDEADAG
jgi:hypothetical protein